MNQRIAIVGTAQSWTMTPWTDPSLQIWSLNDAYRMKGFVRADRWYDFHPLNQFYFSKGQVYAHQIPPGHYVRPEGHLEWLKAQTIPIYLHPDYASQYPDAATWPHARPFPKAAIEAWHGRYFTSSPAWMMAQALMEGIREIHVYGIHLATEFEYIKQRPNFEFLMGCLLGAGKRAVTVKQGLRYYESADGVLVLPEASPVLQENFQYAFEPRPDAHLEPIKWELHKLGIKRQRVQQALMGASALTPLVTVEEPDGDTVTRRRRTRGALRAQLQYLEALTADWQEQMARAQAPGV